MKIKRLAIRRFLALRDRDGFEVPEFCPGINIIHGPNGVGKSTLAQSISVLLDPDSFKSQRPSMSGDLVINDSSWSVDIDAGYVTWFHDKEITSGPDLGPVLNRDRYRIPLERMIADQGGRFANLIARESRGGFDLEAAAKKLLRKNRSAASAASQLKAAEQSLRRLKLLEQQTESEAATLQDLRQSLESSRNAFHEKTLLERVVEYQGVASDCLEQKRLLSQFAPQMAMVQGSEGAELRELDSAISECRRLIQDARQRAKDAETECELTSLNEPVGAELLRWFKAESRRLAVLESDLKRHKAEFEKSYEIMGRHQRRLSGSSLSPAQLSKLYGLEVDEVSKVARDLLRFRANVLCLEKQEEWLGRIRTRDEVLQIPDLEEADRALARWLSTPSVSSVFKRGVSWPAVTACAIGAAGCAAAGYYLEQYWYYVTAVPVIVLGWEMLSVRNWASRKVADALLSHQKTFESTGISRPVRWKQNDVESLHRTLNREIASATVDAEVHNRHQAISEEKARVLQEQKVLQDQLTQIATKLGIDPKADPEWLPSFVDSLNLWREAEAICAGEKKQFDAKQEGYQVLQADIAGELRRFGFDKCDTVESIQLAIDDLESRDSSFIQNDRKRKEAFRQLDEDYQPRLKDAASRRRLLLSKFSLADENAHLLHEFCEALPKFRSISQQYEQRVAVRDSLLEKLAGSENLLEVPEAKLRTKIESLTELSERREDISQRIGEINEKINAAKAADQIEVAICERDSAEHTLFETQRLEQRDVATQVLITELRKRSLELSKPAVYHRAQNLLTRYTRGRLALNVDDSGQEAQFSSSVQGIERGLDELSLGERVQTMLAVRMAFLEHDEPVMLPVVLDETLATTDSQRAQEIIDTVIEIASSGRQVFYFTARAEELAQWHNRLQANDLPFSFIDLAKVRSKGEFKTNPPTEVAIPRRNVPPPAGLSREEYGRVLEVPSLDRYLEHPEQLHLWYVIEDLHVLQRLLQHEVDSWVQLEGLLHHGQISDGLLDATAVEAARAAYRTAYIALNAVAIGRPAKVDRQVLIDSKAVSEVFMDQVCEQAKQCNGIARDLVTSLQNKSVAKWRATNTEKLASYLGDNGFLSNEQPLPSGVIRLRVLSSMSEDVKLGRISAEAVDWMLDRVEQLTV